MNLTDRLSKSRYMEGLRCPLALYLSVHRYDLRDTPTLEQQARFDAGNLVGELARVRFPGGVLIEQDHLHHREAVKATQVAIESGVPAIFEAAFTHDNVKVRADVLRRLDEGGFELIEVKSTGSYRAEKHLADAGVQLHVLLGSGIDVRRVTLMHLNREYVYPGGEYDPLRLLTGTDITGAAFDYVTGVPAELERMMGILALPEPPVCAPGRVCADPYDCAYLGWCRRDEPEPDYSGDVETIDPIVSRLSDLRYPLYFTDFETVMPALPIFVGTRPFQLVRVQWSIHVLHADGRLEHAEWLIGDASGDPDPEFMRALLEALGTEGTFVHYSPYERTQLVDIAVRHPEFRAPLVRRIPGFLDKLVEKLAASGISYADLPPVSPGGLADFDLGMRVVRDGCLHPEMPKGHYTIKTAAKLLARDLPAYEGMAVSNGDQAMIATREMLDSATPARRAATLRADLLEYCALDTLAMVEIHRSLAGR
jgi:hypothetical protein